MTILSGVGALAVTWLLFGWAYGALRRPDPEPWAESEGVTTAICLVLTTLVSVTIGLLTQAAVQYQTVLAEFGSGHAIAIVAMLGAAAVLSRLLAAPALRGHTTETPFPVFGADTPGRHANQNASIDRHAA